MWGKNKLAGQTTTKGRGEEGKGTRGILILAKCKSSSYPETDWVRRKAIGARKRRKEGESPSGGLGYFL